MNTRYRVPAAAIAGCLIAAIAPAAKGQTSPASHDKPNIILIVADDLGYGELGCYGQKKIKTPSIDELASQGLRFTQFYAGSPVCAPSRCTLHTGKHTGHSYVRDNANPKGWKKRAPKFGWEFPGQIPIPDDEVTLAELLKQQGYATAAFGKWGLGHVGTSGDPARQGFDEFYGYYCQVHAHNHYPRFLWHNDRKEELPGNADNDPSARGTHSQQKFVEHALRFIRDNRQGPFFLYLPVTIPHLAIQVPDAELEAYAGTFPEAPYAGGDHYIKHPTPRAGYAAMVSYLDRGVAEIVDLVDQMGIGDNTLIIFTSDNGPTYKRTGGADSDFFESSAGLRDRKGTVYEGGLRVPLIARWTGVIEPHAETDAQTAMWDLMPTLCAAAGGEPPAGIDGLNLLPLMTDAQPLPNREYLYWEFPGYGGQQAVRFGNWKAVRQDLNRGRSAWQLYDLAADPREQNDLAAQHPEVIEQIDKLAAEAHVESPQFPIPALDGG